MSFIITFATLLVQFNRPAVATFLQAKAPVPFHPANIVASTLQARRITANAERLLANFINGFNNKPAVSTAVMGCILIQQPHQIAKIDNYFNCSTACGTIRSITLNTS